MDTSVASAILELADPRRRILALASHATKVLVRSHCNANIEVVDLAHVAFETLLYATTLITRRVRFAAVLTRRRAKSGAMHLNDMPLVARWCAIASVIIGFVLNPLFAFDDVVCFTAYDVLARGQLWRLASACAYVDGVFGCVIVVILAMRAIAAFETQHGSLRCVADGVLAVIAANVCALATSLVVAPFIPSALSTTAISGSGVVIAVAVIGTRQCRRAAMNVDVLLSDSLTISARKLPAVVALFFLVFGARVAEVAGWYLAGSAWAEGHLDKLVLSDDQLEALERGVCARVRRQQGYVGVRGASLPTSSGSEHASTALAFMTHMRDQLRDVFNAYASRRRDATSASSSATEGETTVAAAESADAMTSRSGASPPVSTPSSAISEDPRPKPESRKERAAVFASALERRMRSANASREDAERGEDERTPPDQA